MEDICVICKQSIADESRPKNKLFRKGLDSLIEACIIRNDIELKDYLTKNHSDVISGALQLFTHIDCRKKFSKKRELEAITDNAGPSPKKLRSTTQEFDWKSDCIFCGNTAKVDAKNPKTCKKVCSVMTLTYRDQLIDKLKVNNVFYKDLHHRLLNCYDLVHVEAVYHDECRIDFENCYKDTLQSPNDKISGRPYNEEMEQNFQLLCDWMEDNTELFTLKELHDKMNELSNNSEIYSIKHLKRKLIQKYQDYIYFSELSGRPNVVCFKNMANYILTDKWHSDFKHPESNSTEKLMKAAAKVLTADIKMMDYSKDFYPTDNDISDIETGKKWLPNSLYILLSHLLKSEIKINSIGQCIVEAARPRSVIAPIPFGLGVETDHVTGSKWLVDHLSRLGFSITHEEVGRYKQSVIQTEDIESYLPRGEFAQWVGDNADHDVLTLNGKGTFHGMGIIVASTSTCYLYSQLPPIKRLEYRLKSNEAVANKGVPIKPIPYIEQNSLEIARLILKPRVQLQVPFTLPSDVYQHLLWHFGWQINKNRPSWSGFMEHINSSDIHPPKSEIIMLPLIDLNSSDETCIYSTLCFIIDQAAKLNIEEPCVTFDQPLWLKAQVIINKHNLKILCRLGGFHLLMSFLGSIGHLMKGSGLEEALELIYGNVPSLISGKAFSRSLRGHFLTESTLSNMLISTIMPGNGHFNDDNNNTNEIHVEEELLNNNNHDSSIPIAQPSNSSNINNANVHDITDIENDKMHIQDIQALEALYNGVVNKSIPVTDIPDSNSLLKLEKCLIQSIEKLSTHRTAKLWLMYKDYVEVVKLFIHAERLGYWSLHLFVVEKMANLLAATGHIHYAKSIRLYLQQMHDLPNDFPWLYKCFTENGYHTIRRSDRRWAGLWTDLVIEQVMMRSIHSLGGLTRGRGMTEGVRHMWVHSMHRCASVHNAMTKLTKLQLTSSEQHVELGNARCERDNNDLAKIAEWFDQHNPFHPDSDSKLRSLSSGITAEDNDGVNCDLAEEVGAVIHSKLDNIPIADATIKRNDQIKSLESLYNNVKINGEEITPIDPSVLCTRLFALAQREKDVSHYFQYELSVEPPSLFKNGLMRPADKPKIRDVFIGKTKQSKPAGINVIDGGDVLHTVRWSKNSSYDDVLKAHVVYIRKHYGTCHIVFDGYDGASTKDHEHIRRSAGSKIAANINISINHTAHNNQEAFLNNIYNKKQFISLLCDYLKKDNQNVQICTGDADVLIVSVALKLARNGCKSTVHAKDTDLIVLLLYHWNTPMEDIHFRSTKSNSTWSIRECLKNILPELHPHLLFMHAFTGCDTTSSIFEKGKQKIVKLMAKSLQLQQCSLVFSDDNASQKEVGNAGAQAFILLYGSNPENTSLNKLRYVCMYCILHGKCKVN